MNEAASPVPPTSLRARASAFSYWLATCGGIGKLPKAPGAWGSLAGLAVAWVFQRLEFHSFSFGSTALKPFDPRFWWIALSAAGVAAAGRVERATGKKDPQEVVVDEVSGQWLTLLAGPAMLSGGAGWKSFLAGFILFRVFDMTKPFPAGRAESLPGGWGIMADDWVAGGYAAACLWLARWFGF